MTGGEHTSSGVFIVEDHQLVRGLLAQLVERAPGVHFCGAAASAEEALEQIPTCRPDLILVDISLPGMDGIEFIGAAHARWPDLLILAISGHDETIYAGPALEAGARGYVMKGEMTQIIEALGRIPNGEIYVGGQLRGQIGDRE